MFRRERERKKTGKDILFKQNIVMRMSVVFVVNQIRGTKWETGPLSIDFLYEALHMKTKRGSTTMVAGQTDRVSFRNISAIHGDIPRRKVYPSDQY